jgi:nitrile hydratase accessory protein
MSTHGGAGAASVAGEAGAGPAGEGPGRERPRRARSPATRPDLPGLPCDAEGPVFAQPWQAQVFAMTVALHERGHFAWPQWAEYLSRAIREAQARGDPDTGETYYEHWLAALERLLLDKGLAQPLDLTALRQAWRIAAESTPHGQPVSLGRAARAWRT